MKIRDLSKNYGKTAPVLNGISLDIETGEFIVVVGPSGAGKSVLLRLIAGLEEVSSGEIWLGQKRVDHFSPAERDVALIGQDYALYPRMKVRDNLAFGMKWKRVEQERRVKKVAELLHLEAFLDHKPGQLSAGQRQRVALGRALIKEPRVFLFDEPLSNLDARLRVELREEIVSLHRKLGATSIYVTHDPLEAMALADRLVVVKDGVVQQVGSPIDLYRNPESHFVASFLGSPGMNFLNGRMDTRDGQKVFSYQNGDREGLLNLAFLHAIPDIPAAESGRGAVSLGIRPESIRIARTPEEFIAETMRRNVAAVGPESVLPGQDRSTLNESGATSNSVSIVGSTHQAAAGITGQALRVGGRILAVEPLGYGVNLIVQVGSSRWVVRATSTELRAGERCCLELDREALYWFDGVGLRLHTELAVEAEPLPALALEDEAGTRGLKWRHERPNSVEGQPNQFEIGN